jgi:hypothetical protein
MSVVLSLRSQVFASTFFCYDILCSKFSRLFNVVIFVYDTKLGMDGA